MMPTVFVQIQCRPGTTYHVADEIVLREKYQELYSTSGEFDLMVKFHVPKDSDIGKFIAESLHDIDGIERTMTTLTFRTY